MTKLTTIEVELLDNYLIKHNFTELDQAYFFNALGNIVPSWRFEDLVGQEVVYNLTTSDVYVEYITGLNNDNTI